MDKFNHTLKLQVKFDEVDSFGVVHNIQYLRYLEWTRIKYLEAAGYPISTDTFSKTNLLMVVHQEVDYMAPLRFFDFFYVHTRTKKIGESSITVENLITNEKGEPIVKAEVVMVYIDEKTMKAAKLPNYIVRKINDFENN